jgi:hypothetical protein
MLAPAGGTIVAGSGVDRRQVDAFIPITAPEAGRGRHVHEPNQFPLDPRRQRRVDRTADQSHHATPLP